MQSRKYTKEAFQNALSAVRQNRLKVRQAAHEYSVPVTTLYDHVRGVYKSNQRGPAKQLTQEEETSIVNYLLYMARHGLPMTRAMIRCYVVEIVKRSG
jgi:transposase-like protein